MEIAPEHLKGGHKMVGKQTVKTVKANRFPGICECRTRVGQSEGFLGPRVNGRWTVRCSDCQKKVAVVVNASVSRGRNTYPGRCDECNEYIPRGNGWVRKQNGKWVTLCLAHRPLVWRQFEVTDYTNWGKMYPMGNGKWKEWDEPDGSRLEWRSVPAP